MRAEIAVVGTLSVSQHDANGTWLIIVQGEHDLATAPLLERTTRDIWPHCTAAVIDLSEAAFIDSNVVAWLLRVERTLRALGGSTLSIVEGPAGSVAARALEVFGVRDGLACYATRGDAFARQTAGASNARQSPRGAVPC